MTIDIVIASILLTVTILGIWGGISTLRDVGEGLNRYERETVITATKTAMLTPYQIAINAVWAVAAVVGAYYDFVFTAGVMLGGYLLLIPYFIFLKRWAAAGDSQTDMAAVEFRKYMESFMK